MRKYIFGIMAVIIVVLVIGPVVAGFLLQKKYQNSIASYNAHSKNHITIKQYQRHGWSSDVTLEVTLQQKNLPRYLQATDENHMLPPLRVEQHIQHGPIIYAHTQNLPSIFGWAAIQNTFFLSPELGRYLKSIGITEQNIHAENLISWFGNYFSYLSVPAFTIDDADNHAKWLAKNMIMQFWFFPSQQRISGTAELQNLLLKNKDDELTLSAVKMHLNQSLDEMVWLGTDSIDVAELLWKETDEKDFRLSGIHTEGFSKQKDSLFDLDRKIIIKELQFEDKVVGPLLVNARINQMKFSALNELVKAFYDTMDEGEYYDGQLQQKIRLVLPKLFAENSSIQIDNFSLTAPQGNIAIQGALKWPEDKSYTLSDLREVMMLTQLTLDVQVSKNLITELVQFAATLPDSIRDAAKSDRKLLLNARNQMNFAEQRNLLFIQFLSNNDYISREMEATLVDLQKNLVSMDDYTAKMKEFLLKKQIALIVSYQLRWQYAQMINSYDFLQQRVGTYQKVAEKQLQGRFDDLLKRGYVKESGENYTALLQWSSDGWKSNEIKIKTEPRP